jgi:hypothetical protein
LKPSQIALDADEANLHNSRYLAGKNEKSAKTVKKVK